MFNPFVTDPLATDKTIVTRVYFLLPFSIPPSNADLGLVCFLSFSVLTTTTTTTATHHSVSSALPPLSFSPPPLSLLLLILTLTDSLTQTRSRTTLPYKHTIVEDLFTRLPDGKI